MRSASHSNNKNTNNRSVTLHKRIISVIESASSINLLILSVTQEKIRSFSLVIDCNYFLYKYTLFFQINNSLLTFIESIDFLTEYIIYIPKTNKPNETALPIIVEMQQIVDIPFIKRINQYCLNVHDTYKVFPNVIVFAVKGYSSKALMNDFGIEKGYPYYTTHKQYWAHSIQFYCLDSISSFVTAGSTMTPIVALCYFLCSQQKNIMALDESDDEELRSIYEIAYHSFLQYDTIENTLSYLANDVLSKANKQFEKIVNCVTQC